MISIYYIKKQPRNNRKQKYGTFRNAERTQKTHRLNRTYGRRSCICHSSYIHNALTPKLIHAHLKTLKHTYKRTHTQTVHTRRLNELRFFFHMQKNCPSNQTQVPSLLRAYQNQEKEAKSEILSVCRARASKFLFIAITATRKRALLI